MREIIGFPDYMIDTSGNIEKKTGRKIKQYISMRGYPSCRLYLNPHKARTVTVHRLVALTYLPLIDGKIYVNHKDMNKNNNHVSNLEWCTHMENMRHALAILKTFRPRKSCNK